MTYQIKTNINILIIAFLSTTGFLAYSMEEETGLAKLYQADTNSFEALSVMAEKKPALMHFVRPLAISLNPLKKKLFKELKAKKCCDITIQHLLGSQALVDCCDNDGNTPLSLAAQYQNSLIVKLVAQHQPHINTCEIDPLKENKKGNTVIVESMLRYNKHGDNFNSLVIIRDCLFKAGCKEVLTEEDKKKTKN
jgi:hypothetical protein